MQDILQAKHDPDVQRAVKGPPIKMIRDPKMVKRLKQETKNMHIQPNLNGKDFDGDVAKAQRRTQEILQAKYDPDVQRALHGRDFDGDVKPMRDLKAVEHFKQEAEHMKTGIQPNLNGRDFDGDVTQDILQEKHNPDMQSRMKHIQNLLQAKHDPNAARVKQMLDPSDYEHYHYGKPSAMPDLTRDIDVVNHAEVFAKTAEEHAVGVEMPFKSMNTSFNDAPNKQEHGDLGKQKEDDGPDIDFD